MSPGDFVTAVAWIAVIGIFVWAGVISNADNKQIAAAKTQEAAAAAEKARLAKLEESDLIDSAQAMLPDWSVALSHLKQRYSWVAMLDCAGVNQLHLRLLRQTFDGDRVSLPNMQMLRSDRDARRLIREARALAPAPGWPEDVEGLIQEPTVQTLLDLARMGYVSVKPLGHEPTKKYAVSICPLGDALKTLDTTFRDPSDRHPDWPYTSPDLQLRNSVSRVVGKAIRLAAGGAA